MIEEVFGYQVQAVENCDYVHITYDLEKDKFEGVELLQMREIYKADHPELLKM